MPNHAPPWAEQREAGWYPSQKILTVKTVINQLVTNAEIIARIENKKSFMIVYCIHYNIF